MKLFLYLVALLSGVAGSQSAEASVAGARAQTCASAVVGAVLLQHVTEARAATRIVPAVTFAVPQRSESLVFALAPLAIILKADRARE